MDCRGQGPYGGSFCPEPTRRRAYERWAGLLACRMLPGGQFVPGPIQARGRDAGWCGARCLPVPA